MKRLTKKDDRGYYLTGDGIYSDWGVPEKFRGEDIDGIATIENILGDDYELDRLRELVEADKEGRCVVLPFKPPKRVYMCSKRFPEPAEAYYASAVNVLSEMERGCMFGDTPEQAKSALKAREQND